jgi:hypothetical protein
MPCNVRGCNELSMVKITVGDVTLSVCDKHVDEAWQIQMDFDSRLRELLHSYVKAVRGINMLKELKELEG